MHPFAAKSSCFSRPPPSSIPSRQRFLRHTSSSFSDPGRQTPSSTEAPDPPSSVEPPSAIQLKASIYCSSHPSRPGPESSAGDGVFQSANRGKYSVSCSYSFPDEFPPPRDSASNNAPASSNILMYYQNVGGINSSLAEYQLAFTDLCYDVYALAETWLNGNTLTNQLFDNSYSVYRQDRSSLNSNKRSGGGVLLAVRSCFKSRLLNPPGCATVEQVWVAISTADSLLYICAIYIPPDRVNDDNLVDNHIESLNWVISQLQPRDKIVILGDFNLSAITWHRGSLGTLFPLTSQSSIGSAARKLLDAYCTAGLKQMSQVENESNRMLDLCFVSEDVCENCTIMEAPSPLVKMCRHHPPVLTKLVISTLRCFHDTSESVSYDFRRANFSGMNDFLASVKWDEVLRGYNANLAASTISSILMYAIDQFVPVKLKREPAKPPWTNAGLKYLKKTKRAALRRHSKYRTDSTRSRFLEANAEYKQLNDRLYKVFQDRLQSRLKANPKSFWRYVNEQRKESGLPSTMSNGSIETDAIPDIADLFRSQFSSVFTNERLDTHEVIAATRHVPRLSTSALDFIVNDDMVKSAGKKLKPSTGCGPDGIPSLVLKRCIGTLATPLATVFNLSLTTGVFPNCWKQSFVFPVFKKGCKRIISNYRGIAALSATSKLFEVIVLHELLQRYAHYISPDQHGFMSKRSTTTNLTCFTSFVIRQIENGHQVDAIYTDLSAAFDKMNHQIAVAKFDKLGMNNDLLSGRSMSVKIGDHT